MAAPCMLIVMRTESSLLKQIEYTMLNEQLYHVGAKLATKLDFQMQMEDIRASTLQWIL